jgi:hypothetical protein
LNSYKSPGVNKILPELVPEGDKHCVLRPTDLFILIIWKEKEAKLLIKMTIKLTVIIITFISYFLGSTAQLRP